MEKSPIFISSKNCKESLETAKVTFAKEHDAQVTGAIECDTVIMQSPQHLCFKVYRLLLCTGLFELIKRSCMW